MTSDWQEIDQRMIALAWEEAEKSLRPRKVGAVVADGVNVMGRGCNQVADFLNADGPWPVLHAEVVAILCAAPYFGTTMYTTHHPCSACANIIIQAGILEVVVCGPTWPEWADDCALAGEMFEAAGVDVMRREYDRASNPGPVASTLADF